MTDIASLTAPTSPPPTLPGQAAQGGAPADPVQGASFSQVLSGQRGKGTRQDSAEPASQAPAQRPGQDAAAERGAPAPVGHADPHEPQTADTALAEQALEIAMQVAAQLHGAPASLPAQAGAQAATGRAGGAGAAARAGHAPHGLAAAHALAAAQAQVQTQAGSRTQVPAQAAGQAAHGPGQDFLPAGPAAVPAGAPERAAASRAPAGAALAAALRHGAPETARSARAAAAAAREAAPAPAEGLPPQPDRLLAASAQPALPAGAALHGAGEAGEAAAAGPVTGLPTGAWPTAQPGGAHALPQGATIAAPLSSPQWGAEMSRQVVQLSQSADGRQQIAELRLDPPELGPLRITLSLQDGVAHAVFASSHAAVRQAVEAALPTLEQSLAQAGISLGQANVNDQQQPGQQGFAQAQSAPRTAGAASQDQEGATPVPRTAAADPRSLVDTFA